MYEVARIALYGLIAVASPGALLATLAILSSGRARANGALFMIAFVFAQALTLVVFFLVGSAITHERNNTAAAYLELTVGVGLLALALIRRRRREPRAALGSPRTDALLARLARVSPRLSLAFGLLLGIGPKRLAITIAAAGTIAISGWSRTGEVWLGLFYVGLATLVVWIPFLYFLMLGQRSVDTVANAKAWIRLNSNRLTLISAFALGVILVADAVVQLAA